MQAGRKILARSRQRKSVTPEGKALRAREEKVFLDDLRIPPTKLVSLECAFLDGKYCHFKEHFTLGLHVYHPTGRKVVRKPVSAERHRVESTVENGPQSWPSSLLRHPQ